jgi:hypothetical protein
MPYGTRVGDNQVELLSNRITDKERHCADALARAQKIVSELLLVFKTTKTSADGKYERNKSKVARRARLLQELS